MRPIYSQKQTTENADSAYHHQTGAAPNSYNRSKELFDSINTEEDINNNQITKKHQWSRKESYDKFTSFSPTSEAPNQDSFYLPKSGKHALGSFQNSTINDTLNVSPDLISSSNSSSVLSANIDTTPLFSPSQILKLNRQRLAKQGLSIDEKHQPEFLRMQQKLGKHNKGSIDLNNNQESTEVVKEIMSKPESVPEPKKEEPIKMTEPEKIPTQGSESFNSSSTVYTYKKNTETNFITDKKDAIASTKAPESPKKSELTQLSTGYGSPTKTSYDNTTTLKEVYASDSFSPQYRSNISPRHTVVSRRNKSDRQYFSNNYSSMNHSVACFSDSPISLRPAGAQAATTLALKESRQREKQQLGELNDRFAGYVERVRYLEAQNKKLNMELNTLKGKWGSETKQIEQMYKIELDEARSVLNDTAKTKDCVQLVVHKQEAELENMRRKYNDVFAQMNKEKERVTYLQEQIASNESEISLLKRRLQDLQDEEKRYKDEAVRMMNEIQRVSYELESEMKSRLILENDKQSLEEELIFLKEIHAKEIEELKQLQFQHQGIDPAVFFKNELSHAIKEIREEYEALNQTQKSEMEGWYRIKVSEIHRKNAQKALTSSDNAVTNEQSRRLKLQIQDSKRDCGELKAKNADLESRIRDLEDEIRRESREGKEAVSAKDTELQTLKQSLIAVTNDYEDLMLSKTDLESEIRTYRKLLEGEDEKDGLKQIVEGIEKRAHNMPVNTNRSQQKNMNRSYTVDTGYTSEYKQIKNTESYVYTKRAE